MRLERFSKLFDLSGKVAIVTGGAQGNGQAIANALDDAGATVVVTDVVYGELSAGLHDKISNRRIMDVTDEPAVRRTMGEIYEQYGHLDILVNNAGIMYKDYICDLDIERFRKVLDVNLTGTVICTKHASRFMKQQCWGRIVNIASSQTYLCSETYSACEAVGRTVYLACEYDIGKRRVSQQPCNAGSREAHRDRSADKKHDKKQ